MEINLMTSEQQSALCPVDGMMRHKVLIEGVWHVVSPDFFDICKGYDKIDRKIEVFADGHWEEL